MLSFWIKLLILTLWCGQIFASQNAVIIHSFSMQTPWAKGIDDGIRDEVSASKKKVIWTTYSMADQTVDYIRGEMKKNKPSFVVLDDDGVCLEFMDELMKQKTPTFFTGVVANNPSYIKPEYGAFQTGVYERIAFAPSLSVVSKLKGKIKTLSIIGADIPASKLISLQTKEEMRTFDKNMKVEIFHTNDYTIWKKEIKRIASSSDAIIPLFPFGIKDNGKDVPWKEFGDFLKKEVSIPSIGIAGVNGPIERLVSNAIDKNMLGRQTAVLIRRYIEGASIASIKTEIYRFYKLEINDCELKRLKLVPPSDLLFFIGEKCK